MNAAELAVGQLINAGLTVATAESLTGGLVCAALTSVPGSSDVVRGGLILYATDLKASLGGVDGELLAGHGPVAAVTVEAMARGVRHTLGSDLGVATTGVAGPDIQDGHDVGTVYVAVATEGDVMVRSFLGADRLSGDRQAVRTATVDAALMLLISVVGPA